MIETKILPGDVVDLSATKLSLLNDFDLESCTVLEIDEENKRMKVILNLDNQADETVFSPEAPVHWFDYDHALDVERDYKVVEITDNIDSSTNQPVSILKLAKVKKQPEHSDGGYTIVGEVDEFDTDTFVFVGLESDDIVGYMNTINRVTFSRFNLRYINVNGIEHPMYFSKAKVVETEDIFSTFKTL